MNRRSFLKNTVVGSVAMVPFPAIAQDDRFSLALYFWSGAITTTSARITVCLRDTSSAVKVRYSTKNNDWNNAFKTEAKPAVADHGRLLTFDLKDLKPSTHYFFAIEAVDDDTGKVQFDRFNVGQFATFRSGPCDFKICFASCARTGSDHPVFTTVLKEQPDLFIHMGDFHYEDIRFADRNRRRSAYEKVHESKTQSLLYRNVPVAYIWDDHDFLGNNSDGDVHKKAKREARTDARLAYQEATPHYPLAMGEGDVPIAQAFSIGRVRFVMTDTRSEKILTRTMLGEKQKKWFFDEIKASKDSHPLFVWVNTVPWIGPPDKTKDHWVGFAEERQEIADFLKAEGLAKRVCILSGDSHMLAIDDGSNSDYASGGGMPIPIFQAASLDSGGSEKNKPYSHGRNGGGGQYGRMIVEDDGKKIHVTWTGKNWLGETVQGRLENFQTRYLHHTFTVG